MLSNAGWLDWLATVGESPLIVSFRQRTTGVFIIPESNGQVTVIRLGNLIGEDTASNSSSLIGEDYVSFQLVHN